MRGRSEGTEGLSPSEAFALRLRETRRARELSQTELARRMTAAGHPMTKAGLLRLENGDRRLTLDEAFALAQVLEAVPAHLLSPPEDREVYVFTTDTSGYDGEALRSWLRFGHPWEEAWIEREGARNHRIEGEITRHSLALVDAY